MGSTSPRPTDAELSILRVLSARGPSTVRQVLEDSSFSGGDVGYTTVLKILQIMTDKKLVRRKLQNRMHVYEPAADQEHTQKRLVKHLLDRAFGGSAQKLVMQALNLKKTSPDELREIRRMLDALEDKKGDPS